MKGWWEGGGGGGGGEKTAQGVYVSRYFSDFRFFFFCESLLQKL